MIRSAIRTYLLTQTDLTNLISTRIYLTRIPDNGTYPCITFRRISSGRQHDLDGAAGYAESNFEFEVWSDDSEEVEDVCEELRQALQGFRGTMGTTAVKRVTLEDEQDFYHPPISGDDVGVHRTVVRYIVGYVETIPTF
jgi:hypothetical protein